MIALALLLASSPGSPSVPGLVPGSSVARYVVVVGYNGGAPDPRPALQFADDDAARLFHQLAPSAERAYLLATFDAESAKAYSDLTDVAREPTRQSLAQVLGEIGWLVRAKKKDGKSTELVFAFAGHGDVDDAGEGFVVLADGPFSRTDLETQVLEPSPTDVNHVIIDACASYFMVQARGGAESGRVPLTPKMLDVLKGADRSAALRARTGVLVSTSSAAEVHESSELSGGVFSFLLRSALAGAGDTNSDGRIEYSEAAAFISAASAQLDDPRAKLSVHVEPPLQRPHAPLTDLGSLGAKHFLTIDEPTHLRILDARGVPYAELHTASKQTVQLALVGNAFFVVQKGDREAVLVPRAAGAYALSSLSFEDAPQARGTPPQLRGLFARPLDDSYVAGFLATSSMIAPLDGPRLAIPYAPSGAPPFAIPLGAVGLGTLGVAAAVGIGAGVAVVGNQLAFGELQKDFQRTGQIDPKLSLDVEGWRTTATALSAATLALGVLGGGLYLWAQQLEEGEVQIK